MTDSMASLGMEEGRPWRYGFLPRGLGALVCGVLAGVLIPGALQVGFSYAFPDERGLEAWTLLLWGEHWALRVIGSWAGTLGAAFLAGMVARRRGSLLASLAAVPSLLCWLVVAVVGWYGRLPFLNSAPEIHISIGNKLAASVLVLTTIPLAAFGGGAGQLLGQQLALLFDSRRWTLLGIKWFHYLWLPFMIQLALAQASWATLYTGEWLKTWWKTTIANPFSMGSIVPLAFTFMMWGTLALMGNGMHRAYRALAGLEPQLSVGSRTGVVLKRGFGFLILAAILQFGINVLHLGLAKLFAR